MRRGMPHAAAAQSEIQPRTFWTFRCEHLGMLSMSFATLEAAGTGLLDKTLSCR